MQLWLYITASLILFRLLLIGVFYGQVGSPGPGDLLEVVGNGFRFDISTAAVWVAPTFLAGLLCTVLPCGRWLSALRRAVGYSYVVVGLLLLGADLIFFQEYGDQFNLRIFGLVTDDTGAILTTIWKEYHPIPYLLISGALIWVNIRLVRRWLGFTPAWVHRLMEHPPRRWARPVFGLIAFFLVVAAVRGGTLWGEPIRLKHAFVVNNLYLNRSVVNPLSSLRYAVESKLRAERAGGFAALWPSKNLDSALKTADYVPDPQKRSLDDYFQVKATGHGNPRPRHIFLMLMESQSGWPVLPQYRDIGLSPELVRLANEGIYFPHFLPSGDGTAKSMNALLTGFADSGLNINYEANSLTPYPTAVAEIFHRMGYKTRFFYGGYLSWQRLDSFAQDQGFDEVYGGGSMSKGVDTNEWGVDDADLFKFIEKTVSDDVPSFNFILNTSNHPPYDLPVKKMGFPVSSLPADLHPTKAETMLILGHLWYADREAGRFVRTMNAKLTRPLFALTGDHTARLHIGFPDDNVFEQYGVPFILYGPEVLKGVKANTAVAGSHLDIPPTLYELAAPKDFTYYSLGKDMLSAPSPSYGLGYNFIVGEHLIATDTEHPMFYGLPGEAKPIPPKHFKAVQRHFDALRALSWYRVRKGANLPERGQ